ncbi:MAG: ParA family protein [Actinobacteria bacterium]|nr:ParA family protein [Actinomycetota bacterium]
MAKSTSGKRAVPDSGAAPRTAPAPSDAKRAAGKRVGRVATEQAVAKAAAAKATAAKAPPKATTAKAPAAKASAPKAAAKSTAPRTPAKATPAKAAVPTAPAVKAVAAEPTVPAVANLPAGKVRPAREPGAIPASLALGEADGVGPTGRPKRTFPAPPVLQRHGPARILAMCNQKGGVGKTTSTINLGAALAEAGRTVLLVDFDPQGALSVGLGVNPLQLDQTVYNLLMEPGITVQDVMLKTDIPGLDLLPSNIDLSAAEVQLVNEVAREQTLRRVLAPVLDDYDVVLVDCQPSLGLLTVNALTAAHGVIIPLECEFFALRGVALLIQTIEKVRERLNPELELEGILATMYDSRTLHGREVLARVVEAFGEKVFHTVINRTIRFPETTVAGEPITTYAPTSHGATAYRELALEVLAR